MYRTPLIVDPQQARMDGLRARLRSLDIRITRMRERHAGATDPLAVRPINHSMVERAEVLAELPR